MQFKKSFSLHNQNLYFIKVFIGAEGNAKVAITSSYTLNSKNLYNHQWYFSDLYAAVFECDKYFTDDSTYLWNGTGANELQRLLNLYDHHENGVGPSGHYAICYIPTRNHTFNYTNTYDPYGSQNYYFNDSRVFAKRYRSPYPEYVFQGLEMCYCLDSYLGLGYDYIKDNLYPHEFPVCWTVTPIEFHNSLYYYYYHNLHVEYGRAYIDD